MLNSDLFKGFSGNPANALSLFFQHLAVQINEMVFLHNNDGSFLEINSVFEKQTGYSRNELLEMSFFDIQENNSNRKTQVEKWEKHQNTETPLEYDVVFKRKDGSNFAVELSVMSFLVENEMCFLAIGKDVANRKISENEANFSDIFETVSEGIAYTTLTGEVISINKSLEKILGVDRSELIGKNILSIVGMFLKGENLRIVIPILTQLISGKQIEPFEVNLNGTVIEVNASINRKNKRLIGVVRDITYLGRYESKIRKSEAALRKAQQVAQVGSWVWNVQENQLEWSDEMFRIFGIEKETFSGNLSDVIVNSIHPDDLDAVETSNKSVREDGRSYPLEYRIIRPDGSLRYVYAEAGEMVKDSNGKVIVLTGIAQDITNRKLAENELRKREKLLDQIFEILPVGLWIADEKGALVRSNPKSREIWGEEPLVGQNEYHVFKARRLPSGQEIAPDDWALSHTINNGVTITDELIEIDAHDGQKRIILNYTAPVLNEEGKISAAIVVNQDITQFQLIAEQLRQSEEKFRLIAEKASDVVWLIDLKGKSLFVTPSISLFTGYSQSEYLAQSIAERFTPESAKIATETMQQEIMAYTYLKKVPRDFSKTLILDYRCKDGSVKSGELLITPLFDEDDNLKGLHGVTRDVTERVKINEELRKLNAELEQRVLERTAELQESNEQLSRMNKLFVGREIRMVELKEQISVLEKQMKEQMPK